MKKIILLATISAILSLTSSLSLAFDEEKCDLSTSQYKQIERFMDSKQINGRSRNFLTKFLSEASHRGYAVNLCKQNYIPAPSSIYLVLTGGFSDTIATFWCDFRLATEAEKKQEYCEKIHDCLVSKLGETSNYIKAVKEQYNSECRISNADN